MKDGDIKGDPLESISIGLLKRSVVGGMKNRGDKQARRDPRLDRENNFIKKIEQGASLGAQRPTRRRLNVNDHTSAHRDLQSTI